MYLNKNKFLNQSSIIMFIFGLQMLTVYGESKEIILK